MKRILLVFLTAVIFYSCGTKEKNETSVKETNQVDLNQIMTLNKNERLFAVIQTSMGTIEIELYDADAPKTVRNFVGLASSGFYNGVIFHRVIKDFMIQGGDPTGTGAGGSSIYGGPFDDEFSISRKHDSPGILSMANSGPNSNQSQFFITVVPTPWLDLKHTIFGKVVKGMNVVYAISTVTVNNMDKPIADVVIENITVEKRSI